MFAHLNSIGLYGMDAFEVNVEADIFQTDCPDLTLSACLTPL